MFNPKFFKYFNLFIICLMFINSGVETSRGKEESSGWKKCQVNIINSEDMDLTFSIIEEVPQPVVELVNATKHSYVPSHYDWVKTTFMHSSRNLRQNLCVIVFVIDLKNRRNYLTYLYHTSYEYHATIYFIQPSIQKFYNNTHLSRAILQFDSPIAFLFLLNNTLAFLNPITLRFEIISRKGKVKFNVDALHKFYAKNRCQTCIKGRANQDMKCENFRHFLQLQNHTCFTPDPIYLILGKHLNSTMTQNCKSHFTFITQNKGFVNSLNVYKNFLEKTVNDNILYCYSKPTILKMVFTKFITTIGWSVWLFLFCILIVSKTRAFKSRSFDIVTVLLRQPVLGKAGTSFLILLISLMTSFIAFRYDAIITSFTASPPVEEKIETISYLFNVKNFKMLDYGTTIGRPDPESFWSYFHKDFEILSVNLSKVLLEKDFILKAHIVTVCRKNFIENFVDKVAFSVDQDKYRTELDCYTKKLTNMTCTNVKQRLGYQRIVWYIYGFGSEEYKFLYPIFIYFTSSLSPF